MLRVCPALPSGAEETRGSIMGNAAVAEELPGAEELEDLYRLDASETGPEDGDEDDLDDDEDDQEGDQEFKPEGMPHP